MLVMVRAHFCDIDARVLSGMQVTVQTHVCILTAGCKGAGMQLRWWFRTLFGVLVDGWVSWGVLFGVLFRVMVRGGISARLTAGFCLGRSSGGGGGAFGGAGVQALLSGIYACVIFEN